MTRSRLGSGRGNQDIFQLEARAQARDVTLSASPEPPGGEKPGERSLRQRHFGAADPGGVVAGTSLSAGMLR